MEPTTSNNHNDRYIELVTEMLEREETIELIVKQSRLWPGVPFNSLFQPLLIFVTNERLIIISRHNLGLKRNMTIVPLTTIRSIRLEKGLFLSSVVTAQLGSGMTDDPASPRSMDGLSHHDARILMRHLTKQIREMTKGAIPHPKIESLDQGVKEPAYCPTCGLPVVPNAKFCQNCAERLRA